MKIFVTGANGFVGSVLTRFLLDTGHEVTALVRSEKKAAGLPEGVDLTIGESGSSGPWQDGIKHHDVIINLAARRFSRDGTILTRNFFTTAGF